MIPDLSLIAMPTKRDGKKSSDYLVLAVVECAFSQEKDDLFEKLQALITTRPQIVLAIAIIIREEKEYVNPKFGSEAWDALTQLECLGHGAFMAYSKPAPTTSESEDSTQSAGGSEDFELHPVTVAGHRWCNISSVKLHAWVKQDDTPINIGANPDGMAQGVSMIYALSHIY